VECGMPDQPTSRYAAPSAAGCRRSGKIDRGENGKA
jgi:hypothetical protein